MRHLIVGLMLVSISFAARAQEKPQETLGIKVGEKAPLFTATSIDKKPFRLKDALGNGPVLLVFYRGGWCPYCSTQLRKLKRDVYRDAQAAKTEIVAVSVDRIEEGAKTKKSEALPFTVISDPDMQVIEQYNLKYKVPEELVKKYKTDYKIDLEKASGKKHHTIAVPGVFLISTDGVVTYAYVNKNYKVRAPTENIVMALKKLAAPQH